MDLDHRFLVLLIVVGSNRPRRTDQLNNICKFVHFCPMSSVEAIAVSEVDICSLSQKQFNYFLVTESSRVVEGGQTSLIANCGISSIVQQQRGDFIVILFDGIVQWRFFSNIMILLCYSS